MPIRTRRRPTQALQSRSGQDRSVEGRESALSLELLRKDAYMAAVAGTTLLSACLLFYVQPLVSKQLLPRYGGSPGVWIACMLFFQSLLLAGYAYSHALSRW